jgi:UDP-N-acetylglucosamine 2-epimerase (non-hydrolysing)
MSRLKVMTIVGTRPEIIRLSRTIAKLDQFCEHTLVHTGQNYDYELNAIFFEELGIRKPDVFLDAAGNNPAQTIGNIISRIDEVFTSYRPEAVLILGDTNSSLAAISAKRRKIPIFHMEAGNRCFDEVVPEEINRKIVDHIADINLTYSSIARDYLLREGISPDQVIKTGSPMNEVIQYYLPKIIQSKALDVFNLKANQFFLVSIHREENVDDPQTLAKVLSVLEALATRFNLPVIVSTHPRTKKRLQSIEVKNNPLIRFEPPFGFLDYIFLQTQARCVLSDSGTITEESSILNFPALNLRSVHERPEGFEEASVMMVGLSVDRVMQALDILGSQKRGAERDLKIVGDYQVTNVSDKVLRIIQSYTDFINQRTWKKNSN